MKLRIYSDLHLEFNRWQLPALADDENTILVLAGDIYHHGLTADVAIQWAPRFRALLLVLGNHDYYGNTLDGARQQIEQKLQQSGVTNIHLLSNSQVTLDNTTFIGGTLWTQFQTPTKESGYCEAPADPDPFTMYQVQQFMPDYKQIDFGPTAKENTPSLLLQQHRRTANYLKQELPALRSKKHHRLVVITHHVPSFALIHPIWKAHPLSGAYASSLLDDLPAEALPDMWIFGHQHEPIKCHHRGVLCVSNPLGYSKKTRVDNPDFNRQGQLDIVQALESEAPQPT